ncbi:hypothetical protein BBJ29_003814 [Phytophthora kernoviae]|uniref:Uncharacterized protein n=1 Tax=Phytophthora kernoviae TaxID=325452 RepID=A0A3F2RKN0_9STRA|nr:hypothetical protein BBP00_00006615 [Phytophthora kernoviae]RLN61415.1 hypothetical protein BBJ29_003814 [Phytophthora kernoviae]
MVQLRGELDADRNARWKNDAAVDAKLDAQIERLTTKLTADKRDMARVLDEQRQLMTGADFQRVTAHMREFSRVNDHLLALERWLHSEFGQVKRIFQTMAGDVDARFQFVLVELANGLKAWHAAQARQEDELGMRVQDLEDATRAVALAVQRKLRALEEVVPLEVQARQKNDDKIRRPLVSPSTQANDEIRAETKRIKEELDALQVWSAKHAQECRQFFDFLNWSMEDSRREIVVTQCLDDVIDQIVEAHALEKICAVEKNVSGALRQIEQNSSAHTKLLVQQVKLREGSDDYHDDRDFIEETNEPLQSPLEPALQPVNDDLGLEEPSILDL